MPFPRLCVLLAGCLAAAVTAAQQAPLLCPPAPAGRPCESFHYHVAMYRPDTRGFAEISAIQPFATQAACERAREQMVAANAKVLEGIRVRDQKYEADRIGACHCDMTTLTDTQRAMQFRTAEEIRLRVRERLLDNKMTSDSEAIRALYVDPPATPLLGSPKLVPLPSTPSAPLVTSPDDLKPTQTLDISRRSVAALDVPLVDIAAGGAPLAPLPDQPLVTPPVGAEPVVEERVTVQNDGVGDSGDPPTENTGGAIAQNGGDETTSAETAAERFIGYENERIRSILDASTAIGDEDVKTRIFQACMERIQLLSNLRLLIEGSGSRSALAAAARDAQTEADRLSLVARLFGEGLKSHWAPKDAADIVFTIDPAVASAPERVLRDKSGTFSSEQKKRALYLVLAETQPTEEQRLWLSSLVEGFLR